MAMETIGQEDSAEDKKNTPNLVSGLPAEGVLKSNQADGEHHSIPLLNIPASALGGGGAHRSRISEIHVEHAGKLSTLPRPQVGPEEKHTESGDIPYERNLREVGLKEAFPHSEAAPDRVGLSELDPQEENGLPKIRTYAADMGDEMKKRNATLSTIIGAEKARPESAIVETPEPPKRHWMYLVAAILLIIVGIAAVAATLYLRPTSPPMQEAKTSLIAANKQVDLQLVKGVPLSQTLGAEKNSTNLNLGEIEAVTVMNGDVALQPEALLLALGAPDELARNASDVFVGIHAFNHSQPVIIVSVSAYDFAFHAMLEWEKTAGSSLDGFFAPSGTSGTNAPELIFKDTVTSNIDSRKSQDEWPILWAFPRQDLLVITTNENTLKEVLTRLSLQTASSK